MRDAEDNEHGKGNEREDLAEQSYPGGIAESSA